MDIIDEYDSIGNYSIEIISGTASGADSLGEEFANTWNLGIKRFPAEWNLYGKSAGYKRNTQMAKYITTDNKCDGLLVVFWDKKSVGTKHMIDTAKKCNLKTCIITFN